MKILHIITSLSTGGAEKLLTDTVPIYNKLGITTDILLFDGHETNFKNDLRNKDIRILQLSTGGYIYNPLNIFKLIPYIRQYDIIHTHNTAAQFFVAIASLFAPTVLCTTEHNTTNRRRKIKWFRIIDRWMYHRYDQIICISAETERELRKYLRSNNINLCTIYNGIDVAKFNTAKGNALWRQNYSKTVLCMVAAFRAQKDQETVIRALNYLDKKKYELWLVGDGTKKSDMQLLVQNENLSSCVRFWGERKDIPEILQTSDIVIMSSHWEGFGLSAVEGMACGKPVIASDVPGLSQIVSGAGYLFPVGDAKRLSEIIVMLSSDKELYNETSAKCIKRAWEYDITKMIRSYVDVYNNLLR